MKKRQVAAVGFSIITLLFVQVFFWTENKQADRDAQGYIELEGMKTNSVTNQQRETHVLNFIEDDGQNPWTRRIYKPKTENKQNPVLIAYEIEHELSPETPEGKLRRQYAQRHGARGKVTLHVVDSIGNPVSDAQVIAWFWTGDEKNRKVDALTDKNGFVELEENNMSYMGFTINKPSFYDTVWDYWFYVRGYDCVEDGRWIPWNPVLEVVLKEVRLPLQLPQKKAEISFPANTRVGFDFIVGDLVEPYGKGKTNDAVFHVSGVAINGKEFHYTNTLSFVDGSGIVSHAPDSFSILKSDYVAPENGYTLGTTFRYDYDGTHAGSDDTSQRDRILYFKVRGNREQGARYGKIVGGVVGGLAYPDTDTAGLVFSYFLNPNDGDRNLEYEDAYEFKPFLGKSE